MAGLRDKSSTDYGEPSTLLTPALLVDVMKVVVEDIEKILEGKKYNLSINSSFSKNGAEITIKF